MKIIILLFSLLIISKSAYATEADKLVLCVASLELYKQIFQETGVTYNSDYLDALIGIALSNASDDSVKAYQNEMNPMPTGDLAEIHQCRSFGVPTHTIAIIQSRQNNSITDDPTQTFKSCVVALNLTMGAYIHKYGPQAAKERIYKRDFLIGTIHSSLAHLLPKYKMTINSLAEIAEIETRSYLDDLRLRKIDDKRMMFIYRSKISQCVKFGINHKKFQAGLE